MISSTQATDIDQPTPWVLVDILSALIRDIPAFSGIQVLTVPNIIGAKFTFPVPRVHIYLERRDISDTKKAGAIGQSSHNETELIVHIVHKLEEPAAKKPRAIHMFEQLVENQILDNFQIGPKHELAHLVPRNLTFHWMKISDIRYNPGIDERDRMVDELQMTIRVAYDRRRES